MLIHVTTQDYCTNTLASLTSSKVNDLRTQVNDMDKNSLTNILDILGPIFVPELNRHRYTKSKLSGY